MSVVLINSPVCFAEDSACASGPEINPHLPLGLLQLATYLEENGIPCTTLDLWSFPRGRDEILALLEDHAPCAIGINATSPSLHTAWKLARNVKEALPDVPVICGGIHPTVHPASIRVERSPFDYLVLGRGEVVLRDLVKSGQIATRPQGGLPLILEGRPDEPRLTECGPVDLTRGEIDLYLTQRQEIPLLTVMGCTRGCGYCAIGSAWRGSKCEKTVEQVVREIETYREIHGVDRFIFESDNLCMHSGGYLEDLCRSLVKLSQPITWRGILRLEDLDPGLIPLLRESGCREFLYGVDVVSPRAIAVTGREAGGHRILTCARALHAASIAQQAMFIVGFPGERFSESLLALDFMTRLVESGVEEITVFPLYVYPGTRIWRQFDGESVFGALPIIGGEFEGVSRGMRSYLRRYPLIPELCLADKHGVGTQMVILSYIYDRLDVGQAGDGAALRRYLEDHRSLVDRFEEHRNAVSGEAYSSIS